MLILHTLSMLRKEILPLYMRTTAYGPERFEMYIKPKLAKVSKLRSAGEFKDAIC